MQMQDVTADPIPFFSTYLRLTGIAHLGPEKRGDPRLLGRRLGLLNGSSWITLWSNYFARLYLPGIHLVNVGNEALQLRFMRAHQEGDPCPPQATIDCFVRYAKDLVELAQVDAVLITCSTMNRSYTTVARALEPYRVPVVQIDQPMMEAAVRRGGRVLVVATHGPTVSSTQALLNETSVRLGQSVAFDGINVQAAWEALGEADVAEHNRALARAIEQRLKDNAYSTVVLAQLSMSVFACSFPDPVSVFGVPILTSGQCGFERMREVLCAMDQKNGGSGLPEEHRAGPKGQAPTGLARRGAITS
jgi:Asp/Glu/hydantoin racemase